MVECSFCGGKLAPGTGLLFVKKEGTMLFFCSSKCEKNLLVLKRRPTATKWAQAFLASKEAGKEVKVEKKPVEEKREKKARQKKKRVRRKKKR